MIHTFRSSWAIRIKHYINNPPIFWTDLLDVLLVDDSILLRLLSVSCMKHMQLFSVYVENVKFIFKAPDINYEVMIKDKSNTVRNGRRHMSTHS